MTWRDDIETAQGAVDLLCAVDVDALSPMEKSAYLRQVNLVLRRLDHHRHEATWTFERSGALPDVGYRTLAQWHRDQLHLSTHEAGRIGALARALVHLPTASSLWAAGEIGAEAARELAALRTPATADAFDRDEAWLAAQARDLEHHELRARCRKWRLAADPDGPDPGGEPDARASTTFGGIVKVDATLEPITGAAFKDLFDEICDELFQADWSEAKERLGREPSIDELRRTPKQRRHDVFGEIVRRARAGGVGASVRPLLTVVTGLDALADGLAELWNGTPLAPGELARLLAEDPLIQRFAYGADEQPIAFSPRARLFTGKLREAILTRDRRCTGRGCTHDTRRGAVDHIDPFARGGETTPTNGRGACHPCNRSRPRRRFRCDPRPHDDDPP